MAGLGLAEDAPNFVYRIYIATNIETV